MNRDEKIVITGMGVISPLGHTIHDFWYNLINAKCGIKKIRSFDTSDLPTQIAGEIDDFNPLLYMDKKTAKRSSRYTQYSLAVVEQALLNAELELNEEDQTRTGVYIGSGSCNFSELAEKTVDVYLRGLQVAPYMSSVMYCNHSSAYTIACQYQIKGPTITVSSACNSSFNAMEIAMDQLKLYKIDRALVVGAETLGDYTFKAFCRNRSMSMRNGSPHEASRPFDRDRDGFVASEGAGAIVLERKKDAFQRHIRPYAEIVSCASTNDAYSLIKCEPSGLEMSRAMELALEKAKVEKEKITYVSAHGPSMPDTDIAETIALKRVFNSRAKKLQVSSIKGALGSPIGATNIFQVIAACMSIDNRVIPPTINYDNPDPACDLDYVPWDARDLNSTHALINSHAFGGGNTSIVLATI